MQYTIKENLKPVLFFVLYLILISAGMTIVTTITSLIGTPVILPFTFLLPFLFYIFLSLLPVFNGPTNPKFIAMLIFPIFLWLLWIVFVAVMFLFFPDRSGNSIEYTLADFLFFALLLLMGILIYQCLVFTVGELLLNIIRKLPPSKIASK